MATPQHHHITTGGGSASLLRQGAISRHQRLQTLVGVDGRRQGDQASGLELTQGRVDVLPPQIVGQVVTVELGKKVAKNTSRRLKGPVQEAGTNSHSHAITLC